jgi:hypothetical protein
MPQDNSQIYLEHSVASNRKVQGMKMTIKVAKANLDKHEKKVTVMESTHKEILKLRKAICYNQKSLVALEKCPSTTENVRIAQCKARISKQEAELAKLQGPKVGSRYQYVAEVGTKKRESFTKKNNAMRSQVRTFRSLIELSVV